jgi:hypothetical protein
MGHLKKEFTLSNSVALKILRLEPFQMLYNLLLSHPHKKMINLTYQVFLIWSFFVQTYTSFDPIWSQVESVFSIWTQSCRWPDSEFTKSAWCHHWQTQCSCQYFGWLRLFNTRSFSWGWSSNWYILSGIIWEQYQYFILY